MNLNELHEKLSADVEGSVEQLRREEAEMERKFPGYPPYISEHAIEQIQGDVTAEVGEMMGFLTEMFGYAAVKGDGYKMLSTPIRSILERLAKNAAHEAAGHMASESARQATRASHNMLMGTLAGIRLGAEQTGTDR